MASARSSGIRPRDAIGSLCHLLNLGGTTTGLSPETFRQAKFNKQEVVAPLWSLLSDLTPLLSHGCPPLKDGSAPASPASVKRRLRSLGYRCRRFHSLPDDMSGGSRELLLACGWALAKRDLARPAAVTGGVPPDTAHLHLEEVEETRPRGAGGGGAKAGMGLRDGARYLSWLMGRCVMETRRLYIQQQELCTLTHQIHKATLGVRMREDSPHLSCLETFVLRNSGRVQKYQQSLESEQSQLRVCLKWQEYQSTFWQWMESVLDANVEEVSEEGPEPDYPSVPQHLAGSLSQLLRELEDRVLDLEHLVRDSGEEEDLEKESDPELTSKRLSINRDILTHLMPAGAALTCRSPSGEHYRHRRPPRFHLVAKEGRAPAVAKATQKGPPDTGDIGKESGRLRAEVERLRSELAAVRRDHCSRLNDFASLLPDAVCIPPIGSAR